MRYLPTKASGGPVDTALVKVGGRWTHRKSGEPPVGRVEPVDSAGGIFSGTLRGLSETLINRSSIRYDYTFSTLIFSIHHQIYFRFR